MPNYYVNQNQQTTGEHEVHIDDNSCPTPPQHHNRLALGYHVNCQSAVTKAEEHYNNVDGCKNCIPQCHTR